MKYYRVICMRGHCGAGKGQEIAFAIAAQNMVHACNVAKRMPAVKHTRVVCYAKEISEEQFIEARSFGSAYSKLEGRW